MISVWWIWRPLWRAGSLSQAAFLSVFPSHMRFWIISIHSVLSLPLPVGGVLKKSRKQLEKFIFSNEKIMNSHLLTPTAHVCMLCWCDIWCLCIHKHMCAWFPRRGSAAQFSCEGGGEKKKKRKEAKKEREREGAREASFHRETKIAVINGPELWTRGAFFWQLRLN